MPVSVSAQMLDFLVSCLVGALLGALYDVFRIFRLAARSGRVSVFFQDILFLLICTVVTFLFLLLKSSGSIRLFLLEGEILGAVLYYFTLGILVMRAAEKLIGALRRFFRFLKRVFVPPVRRTCVKFGSAVSAKGKDAGVFFKKGNKQLKKRLKHTGSVMYNLLCVRTQKNRHATPGEKE